jgi:hypothetical protein
MKKKLPGLFVLLLTILSFSLSGYAQDDINLNFLHSPEGKKWLRSINPDGAELGEAIEDDIFIFFSNGDFEYDQASTINPELGHNMKTKAWRYDPQSGFLSWEFILPNGTVKKFKAEINHLDNSRMILNLAEGDNDPDITVLQAY